jgi:FdrA protein
MRIARDVSAAKGVQEASLMIGTPSNKALLAGSGLLAAEGKAALPDDLVIAVRAKNAADVAAALDTAEKLLSTGESARHDPGAPAARGLDGALALLSNANLALISVPGEFAAIEARKALARGLHVMMFSDNVPVEDEVALKDLALSRDLLMMGPDCGTSHIAGVPLAFANAVPLGDIGLVSASGTGLQEVMCLIARAGKGVSHGIGVGGRDLSQEVGARMTLAAFDALDADPGTKTIVLISKPPAPAVAEKVFARVAKSRKRVVLCLLGTASLKTPRNAVVAGTLLEAARAAIGKRAAAKPPAVTTRTGWLRGLFCGGTLCAEAQLVLQARGHKLQSNAPVQGVTESAKVHAAAHTLIDLGDDAYTRGRPHPMIDPELRNELLLKCLKDASVGVVLLDLVIGYGAHPDPAGLVVEALARVPGRRARVIASVTGTDADPQNYSAQATRLREAGVIVAGSNAEAAAIAAAVLRPAPSAPRKARAGKARGSAGTRRRAGVPAGRSAASRQGKR